MIDGKTVSVIVTTYAPERRDTIEAVCLGWLNQPVEQVWLVDGHGGAIRHICAEDPRFEHWRLPRDHGTRTDYALAHLTDGDVIILADDDVLPHRGLCMDLVYSLFANVAGITGLVGRTFHGPDYHEDTTWYGANKITEPVRVGFCGVVMAAHRKHFGFDTRGMGRNVDDLWWQIRCKPDVVKVVVPTKKYENLPCSRKGMFHDQGDLRDARRAFYQAEYERTYGPAGRAF